MALAAFAAMGFGAIRGRLRGKNPGRDAPDNTDSGAPEGGGRSEPEPAT